MKGFVIAIASCLAACGGGDMPGFAPHKTGEGRDGGGSASSAHSDAGTAVMEPAGGPSAANMFSSDEVYLVGGVYGDDCYGGIANVKTPSDVVVGIYQCGVTGSTINPVTGDLLFEEPPDGVRAFRCDQDCQYWRRGNDYPKNTEANDVGIETKCGPKGADIQGFMVSADGDMMYSCEGGWHDAKGAVLGMGAPLIAVGHDMLGLGYPAVGVAVFDLKTDQHIGIDGLPQGSVIVAVRATEHGFHFALRTDDKTSATELWDVDASGVATKLGDYALPPDERTVYFADHTIALGSDDVLLQLGSDGNEPIASIVRRTIDGESTVIYTESKNASIHVASVSKLVTGP